MSEVAVSGLLQGNDPAAGVGVARSLKEGLLSLRLIGVDYSVRSVGLHDPVFDDVVIHRPWSEFETSALRDIVGEQLERGSFYLSTLDLEAYWLARHFPEDSRVLSPRAEVFPAIAKPLRHWPALARVAVPEGVDVVDGFQAVHAFGRRHGWRMWLKGPFHDASFVASWEELDRALAWLRRSWPFEGLHLQAHVDGRAEAIGFAAYGGRLLDAIWILKNDLTNQGKTVAGSRLPLDEADRRALADYVGELNWTGGGEIELIRDHQGTVWIIEINPRFPAWIAGATLLGLNLPALLLEAATGIPHRPPTAASGFVRVQLEIPVRDSYRLLEPLHLRPGEPLDASKAAFSIRELAAHLQRTIGLPLPDRGDPPPLSPVMEPAEDLAIVEARPTPAWIFFEERLQGRLLETRERLASANNNHSCRVGAVYSVKTNPDPRVLEAVHAAGLGAEVISEGEWQTALDHGFAPETIVVNGPGKDASFIGRIVERGALWIADSLDELEAGLTATRTLDHPTPRVGVRLRPPGVLSRFGLVVDEPRELGKLIDLLREHPAPASLLVHVHVPHALMGRDRWRGHMMSLVDLVETLAFETGRRFVGLDLGGGFYPDDFAAELEWIGDVLRPHALASLAELQEIFVEPGRALVQEAFAVSTRVLEVRTFASHRVVVVDASLAELSEAGHFPHPFRRWKAGDLEPLLDGGRDTLVGRTCMEADVLARSLDLGNCTAGDTLLVMDAGSYDRSMAYDFGRGRTVDTDPFDRDRVG